jgi:hypothetical protein
MTGLWSKQVCSGAMGTPQPHIGQGMPAHPSSQVDRGDEAGEEAAQQEEETMAILYGCGRLAEAESE